MEKIKIGIPLGGKMATRVLHQPSFRARLLNQKGIQPVYLLWSKYFRLFDFDQNNTWNFKVESYDEYDQAHRIFRCMKKLRRFVIITETTDLRFGKK